MVTTKKLRSRLLLFTGLYLTYVVFNNSPAGAAEMRELSIAEEQSPATTKNSPDVFENDHIYRTARGVLVIPEYKLIFFTFPKVACTEWKRMFMRMNNNPHWCLLSGGPAVHDPSLNKIKTLDNYAPEVATLMMTSPDWTRAAIAREPKERILSAFLDKAVKTDYYAKHCCEQLPNHKLTNNVLKMN